MTEGDAFTLRWQDSPGSPVRLYLWRGSEVDHGVESDVGLKLVQ